MDIDAGSLILQLKDKELFKQQCFINGEWLDAVGGETFAVKNPSDSSTIGTMPAISRNEVKKAIDSAHSSWLGWKKLTGKERSAIIRRWHDLILENIDDLALIMTLENGKPIPDARGEIVYASWFVDWFS